MSYRADASTPYRTDVVTIPVVWLAIVLSLLVHVAALWTLLPDLKLLTLDTQHSDDQLDHMQVALAPAPTPAPAPPPAPPPPTPRVPEATIVPRRPTPPRRTPTPPVLTAPAAPSAPSEPVVQAPAPTPTPPQRTYPPIAGDLSSYIEARRRERGEAPNAPPTPPGPQAQGDRPQVSAAIAANLPATQSPIEGAERRRGGGIFEIKRMAYDDAAFEFYGWNSDMGRKTAQLIEVRKGDNSDMRLAVIRRMIVIIRQHEQGDFVWESKRLGRNLTLSARPADTARLEAFMMEEFFEGSRVR